MTKKVLFSAGVFLLLILFEVQAENVNVTTIMPENSSVRGASGVAGDGPNNSWNWRTQPLTDGNFYVGDRLGVGTVNPQSQFQVTCSWFDNPEVGSMGFGTFDSGNWRDMWYSGGNDGVFVFANISPLSTGGTDFIHTSPGGPYVIPSMRIGNDGRVGIGLWQNPTLATLHVSGIVRYRVGSYAIFARMVNFANNILDYDIDNVPYAVTLSASSKRFKENITDLELDTSKIYGLRPVSFNWKKDRGGARDFGIIAEEAAKISPLLVSYDKDGKPFTVRYELLSVLLLNELKKKAAEMDKLERTVEQIGARIKILEQGEGL